MSDPFFTIKNPEWQVSYKAAVDSLTLVLVAKIIFFSTLRFYPVVFIQVTIWTQFNGGVTTGR